MAAPGASQEAREIRDITGIVDKNNALLSKLSALVVGKVKSPTVKTIKGEETIAKKKSKEQDAWRNYQKLTKEKYNLQKKAFESKLFRPLVKTYTTMTSLKLVGAFKSAYGTLRGYVGNKFNEIMGEFSVYIDMFKNGIQFLWDSVKGIGELLYKGTLQPLFGIMFSSNVKKLKEGKVQTKWYKRIVDALMEKKDSEKGIKGKGKKKGDESSWLSKLLGLLGLTSIPGLGVLGNLAALGLAAALSGPGIFLMAQGINLLNKGKSLGIIGYLGNKIKNFGKAVWGITTGTIAATWGLTQKLGMGAWNITKGLGGSAWIGLKSMATGAKDDILKRLGKGQAYEVKNRKGTFTRRTEDTGLYKEFKREKGIAGSKLLKGSQFRQTRMTMSALKAMMLNRNPQISAIDTWAKSTIENVTIRANSIITKAQNMAIKISEKAVEGYNKAVSMANKITNGIKTVGNTISSVATKAWDGMVAVKNGIVKGATVFKSFMTKLGGPALAALGSFLQYQEKINDQTVKNTGATEQESAMYGGIRTGAVLSAAAIGTILAGPLGGMISGWIMDSWMEGHSYAYMEFAKDLSIVFEEIKVDLRKLSTKVKGGLNTIIETVGLVFGNKEMSEVKMKTSLHDDISWYENQKISPNMSATPENYTDKVVKYLASMLRGSRNDALAMTSSMYMETKHGIYVPQDRKGQVNAFMAWKKKAWDSLPSKYQNNNNIILLWVMGLPIKVCILDKLMPMYMGNDVKVNIPEQRGRVAGCSKSGNLFDIKKYIHTHSPFKDDVGIKEIEAIRKGEVNAPSLETVMGNKTETAKELETIKKKEKTLMEKLMGWLSPEGAATSLLNDIFGESVIGDMGKAVSGENILNDLFTATGQSEIDESIPSVFINRTKKKNNTITDYSDYIKRQTAIIDPSFSLETLRV